MSLTIQELVKDKLLKKLGVSFSVSSTQLEGSALDRKLFVQSIELLQELDDRQLFMLEELGIDMISFEDKHFRVIENLFQLLYSDDQLMFIEKFVYNKGTKKKKKLVKVLLSGGIPRKMPFNTPEDLWEIIQILQD
tara:strand:- start:725 stop:1132 length:408 start_codon:yes stop_codon:yes gene_type:complete